VGATLGGVAWTDSAGPPVAGRAAPCAKIDGAVSTDFAGAAPSDPVTDCS